MGHKVEEMSLAGMSSAELLWEQKMGPHVDSNLKLRDKTTKFRHLKYICEAK